jgi:N-acetylglucosamine kinase-like BadF-type ATPase
MTDYVIGVDIGATKSHLALFDTKGNFVDFGRWGPLNYECLPGLYAQFEDEFGRFVSGVLSKHAITMGQVAYSVLGVGGVDTKKQHGVISGILRKLGFEQFTLVNDAFLGIPAGNRTRTGICAINGSGCTLAGINRTGEMFQIGGVGAVSADMGGGGYLGERLVSAVYSELFRTGQKSYMTDLLFEELGIASKYDYIEKIHEKTAGGTFDIYSCGKMVFLAVAQGDSVAAGILREMAQNYANGIACMIKELRFPPEDDLHIVFAGSVFVKGEHPLLLDSIKAQVAGDNPDYRMIYTVLDVPNVAGAVIWGLNAINDKEVHYEKVCSQLGKIT